MSLTNIDFILIDLTDLSDLQNQQNKFTSTSKAAKYEC